MTTEAAADAEKKSNAAHFGDILRAEARRLRALADQLDAPTAPRPADAGVREVVMSVDQLLDLADAIDTVRNAYLNSFGQPDHDARKADLIRVLYDDKGAFAPILRELAERRVTVPVTAAEEPDRTTYDPLRPFPYRVHEGVAEFRPPNASAGEPVAWQWQCFGNDWKIVVGPVEKFRETFSAELRDNLYVLRPLYASPASAERAKVVEECAKVCDRLQACDPLATKNYGKAVRAALSDAGTKP